MENPYIQNSNNQTPSAFDTKINETLKDLPFIPENFNTAGFLKGVVIGGAIGYILTNEKAQQAIFKAIVKAGNMINIASEELKERFEDAKAEFAAQN